MAGELERLLVRIEADTAILRRELMKGEQAVGAFGANTERQLSRVSKVSDAFVAQIGRSLLRFGALFGTAQLGFKAFETLMNASDINDLARNTALTTDEFQRLAFAIERAGGSQEAFVKGGVRFARNMAELRANTGGFKNFLEESLPALAKQLEGTTSQAEALNLLADAMSRLGSEEDRTLLAIKAFGKGGEDLVEIFGKGSRELKEFGAQAEKLGAVVSGENLENLEKAADAARELGAALEGAFVTGVGTAYSGLKTLNVELMKFIATSKPALALYGALGNPTGGAPVGGQAGMAGALAGALAASKYQPPADQKLTRKADEIDNSGRDALMKLSEERLRAMGREREAIYANMDQELQRFKDMLAEKKITAEEFETARAQLADIAKAKITQSFKEEAETMRGNFREIERMISNTFDDALTSAIRDGKVEWKSLAKDMLADMARITTQALVMKPLMNSLFGTGGAASTLLSGLGFGGLAGAKAGGGSVHAGSSYLVGEKGPEIFTPGRSGGITSNGSLGGVTNVYHIDARGADISVAQRIERALEMSRRSQQNPVSAVSQQQKRFPTRGL